MSAARFFDKPRQVSEGVYATLWFERGLRGNMLALRSRRGTLDVEAAIEPRRRETELSHAGTKTRDALLA
ncbi:MAG TPA: hypothetical protein VMF30_15610 [Pirellulales bacterium]|nr:hypothetical protein [Pirellulales bacterium]